MNESPQLQELLAQPIPNIAPPLLAWYDRGVRVLPWRSLPTPYRVWVSEIMLQQTRVQAVLPYFERFLTALPTIRDLAQADEAVLSKLWEGLGYYSRMRNLQKTAQLVMEQHGGELPASYEALLRLPGIGEYTAGAISSIAFGLPIPAVDGNVLRVFARLLACDLDILNPKVKRAFGQVVRQTLPPERPGDFNQALMELGATVCVPNGPPRCPDCPLRELCQAHQLDCTASLPVKAAKRARRLEDRTVLLLIWNGRVLIQKRPEKGLLAGLWEFPNREGQLSKEAAADWAAQYGCPTCPVALRPGKHIFTHIEWHLSGYLATTNQRPQLPKGAALATTDELREQYALPNAFKCYLTELPRLLELKGGMSL